MLFVYIYTHTHTIIASLLSIYVTHNNNEAMIIKIWLFKVKYSYRFSIFRNVCTLSLFIIWKTYIYTKNHQMLIRQTEVQKIIGITFQPIRTNTRKSFNQRMPQIHFKSSEREVKCMVKKQFLSIHKCHTCRHCIQHTKKLIPI